MTGPTIVFCHVWNDNLRVALGSKSAGLKKRFAKVDTSGVHVQPGIDIVQSIDNQVQRLPELVVEDIFCGW